MLEAKAAGWAEESAQFPSARMCATLGRCISSVNVKLREISSGQTDGSAGSVASRQLGARATVPGDKGGQA